MTSMFALLTGTLLAMGGPVTEVAITPAAGQTSVLIAVDGNTQTQYRAFTMQGPNRLVVDLMGARQSLPREEYPDVNRGGIVSIRTSQYSADVVRVVFRLEKLVKYTVHPGSDGLRISLENTQGSFQPWSSGSGRARPASTSEKGTTASPDEIGVATDPQQSTARHISVTFTNSPIQNVLMTFSQFSGKSIIPGVQVSQAGLVTADIHDQPWDVALNQILESHGLVGREDSYGIIRVDNIQNLDAREKIEPIYTVAHRINYATAQELQTAITPLLTGRGKVTVGTGTNVLIISDIKRVQDEVNELLKELDRRTPQVSIQTKIIFVNRTDLSEMGVSYELKDSRGNQLNQLSSGLADLNGDGVIDPATETVPQGQATVLLGGNSIAALGDAFSRISNPTLTLLSSLVIGRHTLVSFLDALQSANLSDVQAMPQVTTLDNVEAQMMVGQIIPVRVIEAGTGATGQGTFPRAQVTTEQTGIILKATPHVTEAGNILLDVSAERSSAEPATSDAGFIKNTQQASTRVLVKDGETVVFAGLTQDAKTDVRTGIPLLMNLPVIGRLFRHTQKQEVRQDLIILVTPHIVQSPS